MNHSWNDVTRKVVFSSISKGLAWTILANSVAALSIFILLLAQSVNSDLSISVHSILKSCSPLFVSLSVAISAWMDLNFSAIKLAPMTKATSNILFSVILLFSTLIAGMVMTSLEINAQIVTRYFILVFIASFILSWGIKSILFLKRTLIRKKLQAYESSKLEVKSLTSGNNRHETLDLGDQGSYRSQEKLKATSMRKNDKGND